MKKFFLALSYFFAALSVQGQDAPEKIHVTLRYAYWTKPQDNPQLYIKSAKGIEPINVYEMSFIDRFQYNGPAPIVIWRDPEQKALDPGERKARDKEAPSQKKSALEARLVPYVSFTVPKGMSRAGVLILPATTTPPSATARVFSLDETQFPFGSMQLVNLTRYPLAGVLGKTRFEAAVGAAVPIKRTSSQAEAVDFKVTAFANGKWISAYSGGGMFYPVRRSLIFVLSRESPNEAGPVFELRSIDDILPPTKDAPAGVK